MATPDRPPQLIHCIYASAASRPFTAEDFMDLLQVSRANNRALGLTGMLLHAEGSFFQVLEGQAEVVDKLYAKIESDGRHDLVTRIIREPIHKRSFDNWTMGFYQPSHLELTEMTGTNGFFSGTRGQVRVDAGRALKLLEAFRAGRWRQALSGVGAT